jgi:hypothetical protein
MAYVNTARLWALFDNKARLWHPALIDDETWTAVRDRLAVNAGDPAAQLVFRLNHTIQQQGAVAVGWVEHTRNPSERPQEMGFAALNPSYRVTTTGLLHGYYYRVTTRLPG